MFEPAAFEIGKKPVQDLEVRRKGYLPILIRYDSMRDITYTSRKIRIVADRCTIDIEGRNLMMLVDALGNETARWIQKHRHDNQGVVDIPEIEDIQIDGTFFEGVKEGLKDGFLNPYKWIQTGLSSLIDSPHDTGQLEDVGNSGTTQGTADKGLSND